MDGILTETKLVADGRLLVTRSGGIAAITFNNPDKLNAMSLSMWQGLSEICHELREDPELRVVTLQGAGDRAFVVGADISEFGEKRSDAQASAVYNAAVSAAEAALETLPVPTLALIRGYCIGGGLGIAMRCDMRLARADARFAITAARLGLGYGYDGVASLHRRLGHAATADLLFSGRKLKAEEALAKGLCDQVHPMDQFDAQSAAYVEQLAQNAPLTIRATKAALCDLALPEAQRDPTMTQNLIKLCFDSNDYQEGQTAFAERRPPGFTGI